MDYQNTIMKMEVTASIIDWQITWFTSTVHNQDNEQIPNSSDYILLLQFIRHKTEEGKLEILLNTLIDYVKQI